MHRPRGRTVIYYGPGSESLAYRFKNEFAGALDGGVVGHIHLFGGWNDSALAWKEPCAGRLHRIYRWRTSRWMIFMDIVHHRTRSCCFCYEQFFLWSIQYQNQNLESDQAILNVATKPKSCSTPKTFRKCIRKFEYEILKVNRITMFWLICTTACITYGKCGPHAPYSNHCVVLGYPAVQGPS